MPVIIVTPIKVTPCLLYTSDAADERSSVDLGGRRIIKQINEQNTSALGTQIRHMISGNTETHSIRNTNRKKPVRRKH